MKPSADEEVGVVITMREIYKAVQALDGKVGALDSKVGELLRGKNDHENRLRTVEHWMYGIPASFLVAVAGIVTAVTRR